MSHSFKKSLQKEILHRSSIAAFVTLRAFSDTVSPI